MSFDWLPVKVSVLGLPLTNKSKLLLTYFFTSASNPAVFAETVSKEELDTNNQNMVEEVSQNSEPVGDKKEGDEPESGSLDENKEANSAEVSEMVNEEGHVEIEEITGTVSTAADFVITNGVLTSYTGTATEIVIPGGVTSIEIGRAHV